MIAVAVVFPVLGILSVGLRVYVRRVQKARILADDWLLLPALVGLLSLRSSEASCIEPVDIE